MAHETATVSTAADVFDALMTFLTTQVGWSVAWGNTASRDVVLQTASSPSGEAVYLGFQHFEDPGNDRFALQFFGMQGVLPGAANMEAHINVSPRVHTWMNDSNLTYWFTANDHRVVGVVKSSTVYHAFYAGLFLPFCVPDEYKLPLFVAGTTGRRDEDLAIKWDYQDDEVTTGLLAPMRWVNTGSDFGPSNAHFLDPGLVWRGFFNDGYPLSGPADDYFLWPNNIRNVGNFDDYYTTREAKWLSNGELWPGADGVFVDIILMNRIDATSYGVLDGVGVVPAAITPESTVTLGGTTYVVFPNVWRLGQTNLWLMET